jgi:hypothetical protein
MGEDNVKSDLDKYMDIYVDHVSTNLFELFPKGNDAAIADAILELFRKRESLDIFNKKALYIYIREMVDVKTPKPQNPKTPKPREEEIYINKLNNG